MVAVFGTVVGRVLPGTINPWGGPPGVVVAVFGPVVGRVLPGAINPWGGPPGVVVAVFGPVVGRMLPGAINPGGGPPGAPGRGASVAGLPSVVAPGSAAVWIGAGGG